DRGDRLDILQPFERLDRRKQDYVLVGPWRVFGGMPGTVAPVSRVRPLAGNAPVSERRILRQANDRARLLGGFHLGNLDAHDALIEDAGDQMRERFMQPHDGRDVGGLEPARQFRDRFQVEGPVFVVDRAIIEASRLDNPGNAARRELLEPGAQRRPPLAHGAPYAVLFHGSPLPYHEPVLAMLVQGSAGGSPSPSCNSSMEMPSGVRMKAMRPSRGGRLIVTPWSIKALHVS